MYCCCFIKKIKNGTKKIHQQVSHYCKNYFANKKQTKRKVMPTSFGLRKRFKKKKKRPPCTTFLILLLYTNLLTFAFFQFNWIEKRECEDTKSIYIRVHSLFLFSFFLILTANEKQLRKEKRKKESLRTSKIPSPLLPSFSLWRPVSQSIYLLFFLLYSIFHFI